MLSQHATRIILIEVTYSKTSYNIVVIGGISYIPTLIRFTANQLIDIWNIDSLSIYVCFNTS